MVARKRWKLQKRSSELLSKEQTMAKRKKDKQWPAPLTSTLQMKDCSTRTPISFTILLSKRCIYDMNLRFT